MVSAGSKLWLKVRTRPQLVSAAAHRGHQKPHTADRLDDLFCVVQAQQPQARGRAYRLLASALSSEGDAMSGKLSYGDVTKFWIQQLELPDPQEIDKEYEELKQSLREALAPERLMILLQEISKYRGEQIVVLKAENPYKMCEKAFNDLETENFLPCWMNFSCQLIWTGTRDYVEYRLTISPNKVPGRTTLSDYGYGHKRSF